jgi:hypothetical protein
MGWMGRRERRERRGLLLFFFSLLLVSHASHTQTRTPHAHTTD